MVRRLTEKYLLRRRENSTGILFPEQVSNLKSGNIERDKK
jgi:hypothetical protein